MLQLLSDNLLSPPILFFFLGVLARWLRSDLSIPEPLPRLFGLYLLWAIGFKGGVSIAAAGLGLSVLVPLLVMMGLSIVLPLVAYPVLRRCFNCADACATAAAFGSVSVVTFITASNFLTAQGIESSGYLVAALALMEFPAIITGVVLYRILSARQESAGGSAARTHQTGFGSLVRESLLSGPVYLLLGSMVVGALTGERGWGTLQTFSEDIFHGILVLFLLESGIRAAERLNELGKVWHYAAMIGIGLALLNASIGAVVAWLLGMSTGDGFLLIILCASASYIAVPATMRIAIPEANAGVYLPMALGITFPFNIAFGIPLYLMLMQWITGEPG